MASKATTHVIRGRLDWAKVLGKPRPHTGKPQYDKGPYWSFDLTPNADGIALLKTILNKKQFAEKMREPGEKDDRTEDYITFRHLLNGKDGEKNDPIRVVDAYNNPWPQDRLIGNGSIADVKFRKVDFDTTVGLYVQAIRVLKHVPYEGGPEFEPLSEEDEFFATGGDSESSGKAGDSENIDDFYDDDVPM